MDKLTPSEIIKFRAECFMAADGAGIFSLYSAKSDMKKVFSPDGFAEHFRLLTKGQEHAGLNIVTENIKGNLAEVKYIEHISESGELTTFYSKTTFTREESGWKILKEKREKK